MGLQPIDLQTMYSQLSNVARQAAHQQQGVQLSESMQQAGIIRQNQEQAEKEEQSKLGGINQNGKNNSGQQQKKKEKSPDEQDSEAENTAQNRLKESYLGQHIDITR